MLKFTRAFTDSALGNLAYPVGHDMALAVKYAKMISVLIEEAYPKAKLVLIARGSSGSILGALLSTHLDVEVIKYVRKDEEKKHGSGIFYKHDNKECIFIVVDDFISSGSTINTIIREWTEFNSEFPINAICIFETLYPHRINDFNVDAVIARDISYT